MKTRETRRYEMLVRVSDFGKAHGDLFGESSPAAKHFATVAAAVKELSGHAAVKMSAAREGRSNKATAREALLESLVTIGRTARAIADETPGLEDKFYLPDPQTDQALITAGHVFANDAEQYRSTFVAHALPKAFVDDLHELVDRFEQAIHDREAGKDDHATARANIEAALSSGTAAVNKLDAIIANQLRDDPGTMAAWRRDRRIGYPRYKKAVAGADPPASATAQAAAGPAAATQTASVVKAAVEVAS
jgi:RecA/RadA recombinase